MGTDSIQVNPLRFASNLSRSTRNNIVKRCASVSTIKERIKELAKSWYDNSVINNSQIYTNLLERL